MAAREIIDNTTPKYLLHFITSKAYLYFVIFCDRIFSNGFLAVQLIQAILCGIGVILLYLAGKAWFNPVTGLIAAGLFTFYDMSVMFTGQLIYTTFVTVTLIWFILQAIKYDIRPDSSNFILASIALFCLCVFRRNYWIFFIFIMFVHLFKTIKYPELKNWVILAAILSSGLLIFNISKTYYSPAYDLAMHIYFGNNEQSNGIYAQIPGIRQHQLGHQIDTILMVNNPQINPSGDKNYFIDQTLKFIKTNPVKFITLLKDRFLLLFNSFEISNITSIYYQKKYCKSLSFAFISFGLAFPFALYGFIIALKTKTAMKLTYSILLFQILSNVAIFIADRYRFQIVPLMLLFAAFGCVEIFNSIVKMNYKKLAVGAIILAAGFYITNLHFGFLNKENSIKIHELEKNQNIDEQHERKIIIDRYNLGMDTSYNDLFILGIHLKQLNMLDKSEGVFLKALDKTKIKIEEARVLEELAPVQEDMFEFNKALAAWQKLYAINPNLLDVKLRIETLNRYIAQYNTTS
jgi:hypothetical protein